MLRNHYKTNTDAFDQVIQYVWDNIPNYGGYVSGTFTSFGVWAFSGNIYASKTFGGLICVKYGGMIKYCYKNGADDIIHIVDIYTES